MIKREQLASILRNVIKNGIEMGPIGSHQSSIFLSNLSSFINEDALLCATMRSNKVVIESVFFDPILSVDFEGSKLHFIPVTDGGWVDAVFVVLKYVHIVNEEKIQKQIKLKKQTEENNKEFDWI